MADKLFVGPKARRLRQERGWTLETASGLLGLSISYLSQIEANQRPVSARVLLAMMKTFEVDAGALDADDDQRLIADLREATAGLNDPSGALSFPEIKHVASTAPAFAHRFLELHRAYARLEDRLRQADAAVAVDETAAASSLLPYEEVRDFFHYKNNYLHELDLAAEALSERMGLGGDAPLEALLESHLRGAMGQSVVRDGAGDLMRRYDPESRTLTLGATQPMATRAFQMAFHIVSAELGDLIEAELAASGLHGDAARDVCRVGLRNYAAGALVLPYRQFAAAARELRHDVERLARRFQSSLEQVCHRLSTLQRPGARGVPFYFVRLDHAGNITKRHSATRFQFARFGGACPLWNVHDAIGHPDRFLVQVAEMPDGVRYLCVARSVVKRSGSFLEPDRRYVLGFGCELQYADALVYSEGVDLKGRPARIGISCRICERTDCPQRAFPPVDRPIWVPAEERSVVPYRITEAPA
ncbi:helix-turn-helix domain-containing protein [Phenylobacterium aquaticum]|uniref:helix-turn-helix domain-containing protein n=1 Tax=Phenylobacterium aquaticum TaxID=1763816 RepID=UPI001F5DC2D3|nr:XRE family transcriptional regulator [Phenylobacterium aquaticum]MCI3131934.1 short-chain fatty acyl-CoA regulator family protein [Phenylobacterium aquaticum]